MSDGREVLVLAHLARALSRHLDECRAEGVPVPPEVAALGGYCRAIAVLVRQGTSEVAGSAAGGHGVVMAAPPLLRDKRDAARALGVSLSTLERLIRAGRLPAVKVGAATRIRQSDLDAFVSGLGPRSFRDDLDVKDSA